MTAVLKRGPQAFTLSTLSGPDAGVHRTVSGTFQKALPSPQPGNKPSVLLRLRSLPRQ